VGCSGLNHATSRDGEFRGFLLIGIQYNHSKFSIL
jgi:hypothetical protein